MHCSLHSWWCCRLLLKQYCILEIFFLTADHDPGGPLGGGPHHHLKANIKVLQGAYPESGQSCCWGTGRPAQVKVREEIRKGGQVDAGIWPSTSYLLKVFQKITFSDNWWPHA